MKCVVCRAIHSLTTFLPSRCFAITCDECTLTYVDTLLANGNTDWDQGYDEGDYVWFYATDIMVEDVTLLQQESA